MRTIRPSRSACWGWEGRERCRIRQAVADAADAAPHRQGPQRIREQRRDRVSRLYHPGPVRLIPQDGDAALEVRKMDRVFDNYIMTPMQTFVFDFIRPPELRDAHGVARARTMLDTAYAWLDGLMAARTWAAGDHFSLADCAAAPSLFYADWVHPIPERSATCAPIAPVCWRGRRLRAPSTRGGRIVRSFRPARRTATDKEQQNGCVMRQAELHLCATRRLRMNRSH